ncbi:unnamed protein product [Brachionus calyciflorus]|uniref:non-specific serine/threonine protein kinase n=1 Tax=Brachionus calyciflorus TaxID=104777 RepID=A0A814FV27_9BILA|nr:unnamed protein product [Brachionus calyciflorus]
MTEVSYSLNYRLQSTLFNPVMLLSKKSKLEVFLEVTEKFKPVFRYFFIENFLTQNEWYQKRLNYTKSVATSSIVGYIVGLGDRHVQNILIDTNSADVVHIDLGIAFDQGKILPIPETVPFRLTRDVIDGFGICGIEGIFKNCCEATLKLLKNSREQIITIFEVLLYDPLHNWCLSPAKAFMMQQASVFNEQSQAEVNESSMISTFNSSTFSGKPNSTQQSLTKTAEKNKIAERILFQIKQKLLGYENGTQLSTDGQVNYLINEATNPENLCKIYVGWQPYL